MADPLITLHEGSLLESAKVALEKPADAIRVAVLDAIRNRSTLDLEERGHKMTSKRALIYSPYKEKSSKKEIHD